MDSVTENKPQEVKGPSGKGRDLSNRPDGYKTMGVAGELPIGNNLAERTIRKLTTQHNNSLHYGSDAGAEMAATYHSVIGTVKLHGGSVWNFIRTFLKISLTGAGIMLTWFLAKSLWLPAHVKFKANLLTKLGLGHSKVPFQRGMP